MNKKKIVLITSAVIVILGAGYYIGSKKATESIELKETTNTSSTVTISESSSKEVVITSDTSTSDSIKKTVERNLPEELLPYSDEEIEYARIWLAVMGEDYLEKIGESVFTLNVTFLPKGSLVAEYGNFNNTGWPTDVVRLSGDVTAQGQVIYSSNHDGTVTTYPYAPSHWHYSEEQFKDKEFMNSVYSDVVNKTEVVSIPGGNPEVVKQVIEMENLHL